MLNLMKHLLKKGYAREFVNRIQNMRKDAGFDVIDRITVYYSADAKMISYIIKFSDYISNEVLADSILNEEHESGFTQKLSIGEFEFSIAITKS